MSTAEIAPVPAGAPPIVYDVTEDAIAEARERCAALTCDTPEGYEETRVAIGKLRSAWTAVEARRVELKEPSLEYGRQVDARAKVLTAQLKAIAEPLQAKKDAADKAKAEEKRLREEAALVAREAEFKAAREAEEARIKAEQEAEAARLAAERAAFAEAQAKADEQRRAAEEVLRVERERLDAERAAVDEQKRALHEREVAAARAESERQARAKAEAEAIEKAERERVAAEQAEVAAAAETARLEALKPDIEKVRAWGKAISTFAAAAPAIDSKESADAVAWAVERLRNIAAALETFTPRSGR